MQEQAGPAASALAAIRSDSESSKLSPLTELRAAVSAAPGEAGPSASLEDLIAEAAEPDIKLMRGTRDVYYFSELRMTEGYAKHLFRLAERDPLRLVADTVRDESRVYPRPTAVSIFYGTPFSMSGAEFNAVLTELAGRPDFADIKKTTASNGALYLYSTQFLTAAHAESLAEWIEVGQAENP
jgi:hypothetical protein